MKKVMTDNEVELAINLLEVIVETFTVDEDNTIHFWYEGLNYEFFDMQDIVKFYIKERNNHIQNENLKY